MNALNEKLTSISKFLDITIVRDYTKSLVLRFLRTGPKTRSQIDQAVRANCPYNIDWDLPCTCQNGNGTPPNGGIKWVLHCGI